MGEAPDSMILVEDSADAERVEVPENDRLVWLSQTTLSVDETLATVGALKERFPHLVSPPSDDICYATQNRQAAVKAIAEQCDVMIVVGSGNSSNSVRLVEVALEAGATSAYRVDSADELDEAWFDGCDTVGPHQRRVGARDPRRRRARPGCASAAAARSRRCTRPRRR